MGILQNLPNWIAPTDPRSQHRVNTTLAWLWFAFGIWGVVNHYLGLRPNLADNIPILFMISVYANFVGHLGTAQAALAKMNNGT